jgi:hypothetical protein
LGLREGAIMSSTLFVIGLALGVIFTIVVLALANSRPRGTMNRLVLVLLFAWQSTAYAAPKTCIDVENIKGQATYGTENYYAFSADSFSKPPKRTFCYDDEHGAFSDGSSLLVYARVGTNGSE